MKKFISLLMAAAMVVTMVPATAFAAGNNIKLVGGTKTISTDTNGDDVEANEIRVNITDDCDLKYGEDATFTFTLNNATFDDSKNPGESMLGEVGDFLEMNVISGNDTTSNRSITKVTCVDLDDDTQTIEVVVSGLQAGDVVTFVPTVDLTKTSKNTKVTLDVSVNKNISEDFSTTIITIDNAELKITASVAEQSEAKALDSDEVELKKIVIDDTIAGSLIKDEALIKITLKGDYEWGEDTETDAVKAGVVTHAQVATDEDGYAKILYLKLDNVGKVTYYAGDLSIVACEDVSAGDNVKATFETTNFDAETDDVDTFNFDKDEETGHKFSNVTLLNVVEEEGVTVTLADEDEDMVQAWSGKSDDDEAWQALTVLVDGLDSEEFNEKRKMTVTFPDGVFVTDIDMEADFEVTAYDLEDNEITIAVVDPSTFDLEEAEFTFHFVTEATFDGEVEATFGGSALDDEYSVVIAESKPIATLEVSTVKVESGYKSTELPGTAVFTEAEEDLFDKNDEFTFGVPSGKANEIIFDTNKGITVELEAAVDEASDAEIEVKKDDRTVKINSVSDGSAMVVTLSDLVVYLPTTTALGSYKLRAVAEDVFDADTEVVFDNTVFAQINGMAGETVETVAADEDLGEVGFNNYIESADNFIEVVAAGMVSQTQTSAFTSVVDVTIGANQIVVDGTPVTVDAPAYINKDNRTMVPLRAVAVALGVSDDQIVWVAAEKTVIVNYADTWISMVIGSQIMKVNGIEMAMTTAPEISNSRTFLPMADLGRALGVTATWDAATKTASFNR